MGMLSSMWERSVPLPLPPSAAPIAVNGRHWGGPRLGFKV